MQQYFVYTEVGCIYFERLRSFFTAYLWNLQMILNLKFFLTFNEYLNFLYFKCTCMENAF